MQESQERRQANINKNSPTILEGGVEWEESAISTKGGANLEDMKLAHGEQSATIRDREGGNVTKF